MRSTARTIRDRLADQVQDALLVVGYYTPDGTGVVFRDETHGPRYSEDALEEFLDTALLESISTLAYERPRAQRLHATTRYYDELVDVTLHGGEHRGVVFALERPGDYDLGRVLDRLDAHVGDSMLAGVDVSD